MAKRGLKIDGFVKSSRIIVPVPDQVRDDGSGIQKPLDLLDSDFHRSKIPMSFAGNDGNTKILIYLESINFILPFEERIKYKRTIGF
jgi:hypothetical protein